jgi:putative SOS response-associated peptidase YedK
MCGRYVRHSDKQRIAEHFHVHGPSLPDFGPSWNVAPQTFQPIVRLNRDTGERELVLMRWGLIPFWIPLANSRRVSASYRKPRVSGTTKTNWDCRWQDYFRLADNSSRSNIASDGIARSCSG